MQAKVEICGVNTAQPEYQYPSWNLKPQERYTTQGDKE